MMRRLMIAGLLTGWVFFGATANAEATEGASRASLSTGGVADDVDARTRVEYHVVVYNRGAWRVTSTHRQRRHAESKCRYWRQQGYSCQIRVVRR